MAVPLSGAAGPQGAIMAGRRKGRRNFTTADLRHGEVFANHAAIARELVDARAGQQRLAVLEDRARIARDLHDHVIQRLFAAGLSVQSAATVLGDTDVALTAGSDGGRHRRHHPPDPHLDLRARQRRLRSAPGARTAV